SAFLPRHPLDPPDACASSAASNAATRVSVHVLVHRFIHRFEARYPHAVDISCRFLRPPVREATPLAKARARAVKRFVAEPFAHRIERGVETRCAHVVEEPELPADLDPGSRDAHQPHRTGPTALTILGERVAQQLTSGAEDPE